MIRSDRIGRGSGLADAFLLPLVGRTDSAVGRARRGSPGIEHLTDEGLKVCQPQGPGLTDRVGLAPAADARRAGSDREPDARRPPLLAWPSAESVLPHKEGGELRRDASPLQALLQSERIVLLETPERGE